MTAVYWALQHGSDVPASDEWLSASEREVLARLWAPKRVRDWRLGRWTAKRALVRAGSAGLSESDTAAWTCISIRTRETGLPYAVVGESEAEWVISLSHSGDCGLCAVVQWPAVVGCDIETVGRRGEEFVVDWFTAAERALVESIDAAEQRSRLVTLVWSAKESALKALGVGLRLDTREVDVEVGAGRGGLTPDAGHRTNMEWSRLVVRAPGRGLHGWWRTEEDRVMTIVADPAPALPVALLGEPL
jgi:4'-phosphopantetheinyl transferase